MTKSREMWAPRGWDADVGEHFEVWADEQRTPFDPVPVRVTDISDEPDLRVGDRVRDAGDVRWVVDGPPFWSRAYAEWRVPAYNMGRGVHTLNASILTKLPRKKSEYDKAVLGLRGTLKDFRGAGGNVHDVVEAIVTLFRVERVEDES